MGIFDRFRAIPKKLALKSDAMALDAMAKTPASTATDRRNRKRKNARLGATALIIDDSPTVVAVLRKILRSAGYVTRDAGDAEQGLALLAEFKPDLIFLDIVLPGMNGFGALRAIRKDPATQHIPVVMISGNEHATEQFYANRIGADDFMKKPFSRFEVFARIELLLDANRELRRKVASPEALIPPVKDVQEEMIQTLPIPLPSESLATPARPQVSPPGPPSAWPELDARKALTTMGLQYFDQNQFLAAIQRSDRLAVALFIAGRGVTLDSVVGATSPRAVAQRIGNPEIIKLLL